MQVEEQTIFPLHEGQKTIGWCTKGNKWSPNTYWYFKELIRHRAWPTKVDYNFSEQGGLEQMTKKKLFKFLFNSGSG